MTQDRKLGAALLAVLALAILPAAVLLFHVSIPALLITLGAGIAGVTVTYQGFQTGQAFGGGYTGGTTAPTLAQSYQTQAVVAQVSMGDTETTATLTHNMAISTAALAALQPYIQWYLATPGTAVPILSFALTSGNVVTITKASATGSGGIYTVIVRRPWSASQ